MTTLLGKVKFMVRMCADTRVKDCDFRVAFALIFSFLNTITGQCNPSRRKVAVASTKHKATVIDATANLEALGYVDCDRSDGGRNRRNHYRFNMEETVASDDPLADAKVTETVAASDRNGRHGRPQTVANDDPHRTQEINTGKNAGSASDEARSQESFEREITDEHLTIAAQEGLDAQTATDMFAMFAKQRAHISPAGVGRADDLFAWSAYCEERAVKGEKIT